MKSPVMQNDRGARLNFKDALRKQIELACQKEVDDGPVKKTNK